MIQIGRYFLLAFSILAYFLALFAPGLLITVGLIAFGGTAQLIVPTIGALFWKRSNEMGAITGLIAGILFTVLFTFVPFLVSPLGLNPAMWGLLINAVLFIVISLATKPRDQKTVVRFENALSQFKSNEDEVTEEKVEDLSRVN